jgi:hypothetical protein
VRRVDDQPIAGHKPLALLQQHTAALRGVAAGAVFDHDSARPFSKEVDAPVDSAQAAEGLVNFAGAVQRDQKCGVAVPPQRLHVALDRSHTLLRGGHAESVKPGVDAHPVVCGRSQQRDGVAHNSPQRGRHVVMVPQKGDERLGTVLGGELFRLHTGRLVLRSLK